MSLPMPFESPMPSETMLFAAPISAPETTQAQLTDQPNVQPDRPIDTTEIAVPLSEQSDIGWDNVYTVARDTARRLFANIGGLEHKDYEDIASEALLRLLTSKAPVSTTDPVKFGAYVKRTARNTLLDHIRRTKKVRMNSFDPTVHEQAGPDATSETAGMQDLGVFKAVFDELEPVHRTMVEALVLSEVEGYSYRQIAEMTGCPEGTIRSRIHRAKHLLAADPAIQRLREEAKLT